MTEPQVFQLFGLVFLAVGIGTFLHPATYKTMIDDYLKSSGLTFLGGLLALLIGYLILSVHNPSTSRWSFIITLLGWLSLIKGLLILVLPMQFLTLSAWIIKNTMFLRLYSAICLLFAALFCYLGFLAK